METIRADLHNHPGKNFRKVVNAASKNLGPGGILGYLNYADTNPYGSFLKTKDCDTQDLGFAVYVPQEQALIIRGQEIPTTLEDGKKGEVIVLGLKQNLPSHLKLEELLKTAKGEGGVIIAPHLFIPDSIGNELKTKPKLLDYFDALEVYNGQVGLFDIPVVEFRPFNANRKAQRFYDEEVKGRHNIGAISSTDRFAIGKSYSLIDAPSLMDEDTLRKSLQESLRNHKDYSKDKQSPSRINTSIHAAKVITLDKILTHVPGINTLLKKYELIH